jgi:oxygen-independent coproporphyrinogen III oxidase
MNYIISAATRSLYIHWPFCPYKCHFCPFVAIAGQDQFMERYHQALIKEIEIFAAQFPSKLAIDTVFLGGGTPSTWPDHLLLDMFGRLNKTFNFTRHGEITIEVNPGTVAKEQLLVWKSAGINRLSIGVQGIKDSVLSNLNRKQSKEDVLWVLENASAVFDNISVDLILGLPGVNADEWKELLHSVVQWPIQHVSIYFLTVHEETPLFFRVKKKEVILTSDENMVDLYDWSVLFLKNNGFHQYEISNFSKKGYQSRHNSVYWDRKPYKGFGLGACSFDGISRLQNQKNLMKYMTDIEQDNAITMFCETLTTSQIHLERLMLGLRKAEGMCYADLVEGLTEEQCYRLEENIALLQAHNFLARTNNRIILTAAGLAVQNDIAARLSL